MPRQPPCLSRGRDNRERRIGSPAGAGGAAGHEETGQHDEAPNQKGPVARHVDTWKRHVDGADLQGDDEVAKTADSQWHDAQKDHDRSVHGAQLVVELGQHDSARHPSIAEESTDKRKWFARIGQLPPHQQHQAEAEEQEDQRRYGILNPRSSYDRSKKRTSTRSSARGDRGRSHSCTNPSKMTLVCQPNGRYCTSSEFSKQLSWPVRSNGVRTVVHSPSG